MLSRLIRILFLAIALIPITSMAAMTEGEDPSHPEDPTNPGIDIVAFEKALTTTGVTGWVHGRLGSYGVFVYRESDFFHYAQFPMISHIPNVLATLGTLKRHDKITIKGKFINNGAPQKHIYVTELTVLNRWDGGGGEPVDPYEYEAKIPEDLVNATSFIGRVHFAALDGSMIVCEYKDMIIPIVGISGKNEGLFRGDKIRVHYIVADAPNRPSHLELDTTVDKAVEVLAPIAALHNTEATLTGTLVKFPKSPDIVFDVFALLQKDEDQVQMTYTLVNFDDPEVFQAIRKKLADAWDAHKESVTNGRNKLHNPRLKVKAHGKLNVVSPSQANPQILLSTPDDLTITFE